MVVLDEADRMADMGFTPQVTWILRHLGDAHPQTMLFSATLDGDVDHIVKKYLVDPVHHEVESDQPTVDLMEHRFLRVHQMDKVNVAASIIGGADRCLVFVRTKRGADRVAADLRREGVKVGVIHGDLPQKNRSRAMADFGAGAIRALVATDVAARGLDVKGVDVVIHYDPAEDHKAYLHRSGRTARAGKTGVAVSLVLWDQERETDILQKRLGISQPMVEVFSNDDRLEDLATWDPADRRRRRDRGSRHRAPTAPTSDRRRPRRARSFRPAGRPPPEHGPAAAAGCSSRLRAVRFAAVDRLIRVLHIEDSRTDTELVRAVLGHSPVAEFTVEAVSTLDDGLAGWPRTAGPDEAPSTSSCSTSTCPTPKASPPSPGRPPPPVPCRSSCAPAAATTPSGSPPWSTAPRTSSSSGAATPSPSAARSSTPSSGPASWPNCSATSWSRPNAGDRLAATNAAIREFLAMVVHEIRTPITVISGYASLLRDAPGHVHAGRTRREPVDDPPPDRAAPPPDRHPPHPRGSRGRGGPGRAGGGLRRSRRSTAPWPPPAPPPSTSRSHCDPGLTARVDPAHLQQALVNYATNALKYGARALHRHRRPGGRPGRRSSSG